MVENVSQRILTEFKQITDSDGKKGITNNEERAKVGELLAGTSGNHDVNYLQGEVQKYDLEQAKNQASQDVVKDIKEVMKLDGDKKAIDSDKEIAVLNAIIDNTCGKYSKYDIEYAKQVKKSIGLSETTPLADAQQQIQKLQAQLAEMEKALQAREEEIAAVEKEIENNQAELEKAVAEGKITRDDLDAYKKELEKEKAENKKLRNDINNLKSALQNNQNNEETINKMQQTIENLEKENKHLKTSEEKAKKGYTNGYRDGKSTGEDIGYAEGYDDGYETGYEKGSKDTKHDIAKRAGKGIDTLLKHINPSYKLAKHIMNR